MKNDNEINQHSNPKRKTRSTIKTSKMTLKEFRELTKDLPEDSRIYYHSYYKGLGLRSYEIEDSWIYQNKNVVINPGEYYDPRKPKKK